MTAISGKFSKFTNADHTPSGAISNKPADTTIWAAKKMRVGGPSALLDYQREKNAHSIDGLPALDRL